MKKIYKFLLLSLMACSFVTSCDLTLMPEDEITPGNYFKNESDLIL